jgi:hypothetical protein
MSEIETSAESPQWTADQIRAEHRPLWRISVDGRWHPVNAAAEKLISNGKRGNGVRPR